MSAKIIKTVLFIALGLGVGVAAASYQSRDSVHAMGLMNMGGGKVGHPVNMKLGEDRYTVAASLTWLNKKPGDLKATLENAAPGEAVPQHRFMSWYPPAVDLGFNHWNGVDKDGVIHGMTPFARTNLYTVIDSPQRPAVVNLVMTEVKSGKRVLTMPIRFVGEDGGGHESH
ncbi:MAG: hypothetical protein OEV28_07920 [Nitrospirota bacterium]|nr:hypothetical protein [Nitrospirota bacterium]